MTERTIEKISEADKEKANKKLLSDISKMLNDDFSIIVVAFKPDEDTDKKHGTYTSSFGIMRKFAVSDLMHMMSAFIEMMDDIQRELPEEMQETLNQAMERRMGIKSFDDSIYG